MGRACIMSRGIVCLIVPNVDGLVIVDWVEPDDYDMVLDSLLNDGYCHEGWLMLNDLELDYSVLVDEPDKLVGIISRTITRIPGTSVYIGDTSDVREIMKLVNGPVIHNTNHHTRLDYSDVPNGRYTINVNLRNYGKFSSSVMVNNGRFIIPSGTPVIVPDDVDTVHNATGTVREAWLNNVNHEHRVINDMVMLTPSPVIVFITGGRKQGKGLDYLVNEETGMSIRDYIEPGNNDPDDDNDDTGYTMDEPVEENPTTDEFERMNPFM